MFVVMLLVRLGVLVAVGISFLPAFSGDKQVQMVLIALLVDMGAVLLLWGINLGVKWLKKRGSRSLILSPMLLLVVFVLSILAAGMDPGSAAAKAMELACLAFAGFYLVLSHVFVILDLVSTFKKTRRFHKRFVFKNVTRFQIG